MTYNPSWWEETKAHLQAKCEVFEPPCRHCQHFRPQLNEGPNGHNGFRLCHGPDQYQDFSCFTERPPVVIDVTREQLDAHVAAGRMTKHDGVYYVKPGHDEGLDTTAVWGPTKPVKIESFNGS